MFATIWNRRQPFVGMLLLAATVTTLFVDFPGDWKYLQMVVFIGGWTLALLLLWGVIGTHPSAARARRNPSPAASEQAAVHEPVKIQLFRYGASPWRRGVSAGIGVALGLSMIALGAVVAPALPSPSGWVGPGFGAGCALWGIILCDYARRYLRAGIRVDDKGIKAQLYYRATEIGWDEVVSLVKGDCTAPMALAGMPVAVNAGTLYWVYSKNAKVWFSDSLVGGNLLAEIIAKRTGMAWQEA